MHMAILKWILGIVGLLIAIVAFIALYVHQHDGPIEILAGGAFQSGEPHQGPEPDWTFIKDRDTVELQLLTPPTSRLLWVAVLDGELYIISSYMKTGYGKLWKHWPHHAEKDPRALIRVDGKIYKRTLDRLTAEELPQGLIEEFTGKYTVELDFETVSSDSAWVYRLAPR